MIYQYTDPYGKTKTYSSPDMEAGRWVVFVKNRNGKAWLYEDTVNNKQKHIDQMLAKWGAKMPEFFYAQMTLKDPQ